MEKLIYAVLIVLVIVVPLFFYINGAVDCGNHGGEYVKNWAGYPVCVGGK